MDERQRVSSGSPFESDIGFSRAVRVGDRVLVSGTAPIFSDRDCPDDVGAQARRCFDIIEAALGEVGASIEHVVRTRVYLISAEDSAAVSAVHGERLDHVQPAATMVVVASLLDPAWRVEIEAEAVVPARKKRGECDG
jgi:enamine deaminase RidA (YjgF/YER057c/UK114 family)